MLTLRHHFSIYLSVFMAAFCAASISMAGEGWYAGAGVLYTDVMEQVKYTSVASDGAKFIDIDEGISESGAGGQVHAGYQWLIPFNLGLGSFALEVAGEFQKESLHAESKEIIPDGVAKASVDMNFDSSVIISAKPGFFIANNLLVYGEIGGVYSQMSSIETNSGLVFTGNNIPLGEYGDRSLWGLRVGAGINFLVTKVLSIEAGWRLTLYDDFTEHRGTNSANSIASETVDISDIQTEQAYLGFHYYFDELLG